MHGLAVRMLVVFAALGIGTPPIAASMQAPRWDTDSIVFGRTTVPRSTNDGGARMPHIRIEEERLDKLLGEGMLRSATLRRIVDRVESSDVILMLRCDRRLKAAVAGQLTFLGGAGGFRYVQARVGYIGARARQTAIIGHELQHALEVADTPTIVDEPSFHREYRRIGRINRAASSAQVLAYETSAAEAVTEQILKELNADT